MSTSPRRLSILTLRAHNSKNKEHVAPPEEEAIGLIEPTGSIKPTGSREPIGSIEPTGSIEATG